MKKIRLWVCRKCGRAWHRKKKDKLGSFYCCNQRVSLARTYPKRRISKHERIQEKIEAFKEKYQTKPRTNVGTVLQISKETRQAFKQCQRAKQRPTFLKRAQLFVEAISKDVMLYQTDRDKEISWCRRINENGEITKSKGGFGRMPNIVSSESHYTLGLYSRHWLKGIHQITISTRATVSDMCKTLLHEILHWLDNMSEMRHSNHDCYWETRLKRLEKMFNIID